MKKNGFTLIEMLATIVLIALVGVVATVTLTNVLKDTEEEKCARFKESVEKAACVAASTDETLNCKTGCNINFGYLLNNGYITEDTNPCTKSAISNSSIVSVTIQSSEKKCTYNY